MAWVLFVLNQAIARGMFRLRVESVDHLPKEGPFVLQPFKPGIGMLLNHFRVPVVPTFVHGTYEAMPRGKALPRPKRITVTFGRPLNVDDLEQRGSGEEPQHKIVQALYDRVAELGARLDEAR